MNILFVDQTGKIGGAELSLLDIAKAYRQNCLVALFTDGPFRELLEKQRIPVDVLANKPIQVRRDSGLIQSLGSIGQLLPLIRQVTHLSRHYDVIYANTQKALVVGAIASLLTRRPLICHLHDILTEDHFSHFNRLLVVSLCNYFASLVIADSQATAAAFIQAGGWSNKTEVVYYGFEPELYRNLVPNASQIRQQLGLEGRFLVGHFSRLSPWKGQHILLDALVHCPEDVVVLLVGDALFGEQSYVEQLHQQVTELGLEDRVRFLGFRSDVPQLMAACNLVTHTSTSPEPFGRVIIEAMLCGTPIVAAEAGGAVELVERGKTGWLVPPGDSLKLAAAINQCRNQPEQAAAIAQQAQIVASQRFHLDTTNQQILNLLYQVAPRCLRAQEMI